MNISQFRKTVGVLVIIFFSSGAAFADDFCNGYEEGYKSGYQKAIQIPGKDTMVPICPLLPISQLEQPERNYEDGYKRGFKEGYKKGKEQE